MSPFQKMISGMRLGDLEGFDYEAAIAAGFSPEKATDWRLVYDAYYGRTHAKQQQAKAVKRALAGDFTLDQLVMVEKALKRVPNAAQRMRLRLRLLGSPHSFKALKALVKKLVPKPAKAPEKGVRFSKSVERLRSMVVTADERDIADIEFFLRQGLDLNKPAALQMLQKFLALLRDGGSVPRAVPRPMVLVPLPEYTKIIRGDGDDIVLALTDATTMTGAEFLASEFSEELEVAAFHPQEGAINLYRTSRFANQKQRDLARAAMPVCPFPGCRHGADSCEIHHVTAWKHGGETNPNNLAPLCRYHNGVNDDDPGTHRRGRIEMLSGVPTWVSPNGYPVANPYHPYAPGRSLFGAGPAASAAR